MEIKEQLEPNHFLPTPPTPIPRTIRRRTNKLMIQQPLKDQPKIQPSAVPDPEQPASSRSRPITEKMKEECELKHESQNSHDNEVEQVLAMRGAISNSKRLRKTRTLITKQKLLQMNKIFNVFTANKSYKGQFWNLKAIAAHLQLGYSTILHKFREYRANKVVRAGALISSLQKKRKYRKSIEIEKIIEQVLKNQEFYTAVQMTNYIQANYNVKVSRSIVSRHLGQMGYSYKNVAHTPITNKAKLESVRETYAEIMRPLLVRKETLIYIDEMSCCFRESNKEEETAISILIACTIYGVLYFHLQDGFITRERFHNILTEFLVNLRQSPLCKNIQGRHEELYIVADMNSIHRDDSKYLPGIASMLIEKNAEIYYIPPNTPEFNPIEPIFQKIRQQLSQRVSHFDTVCHKIVWQCLESILDEVKAEPTEEYFVEMCQKMEQYMENRPRL